MKTTFDFKKTDSKYIYPINSNTFLCIKLVNCSVSMLYFTDETGRQIDIPDGIVVYTYDYPNINNMNQIEKVKTYLNYYNLYWTNNYIVELNKNVLVNIKNQREWNIIS